MGAARVFFAAGVAITSSQIRLSRPARIQIADISAGISWVLPGLGPPLPVDEWEHDLIHHLAKGVRMVRRFISVAVLAGFCAFSMPAVGFAQTTEAKDDLKKAGDNVKK